MSASPSFSDVYLLGDFERVVDLNSNMSNGALDLGVPKKQLDSRFPLFR